MSTTVQKIRKWDNQQPSSLTHNGDGEGSTTISKESTGITDAGKRALYLKQSVIYKIIDLRNNMSYIGSAMNFYDRFYNHNSRLRNNKHKNIRLQRIYNKFGVKTLKFDIIEITEPDTEILRLKEQYWMDTLNSYDPKKGYNICKNACRTTYGLKMSKSAKKKISEFNKGKKLSKKTVQLMKELATERQGRTILVYDKNCKLIADYPSVSETARQMKVSIACVSRQATINKGVSPLEQKNAKTHLGNIKPHRPKYYFRYKDIV